MPSASSVAGLAVGDVAAVEADLAPTRTGSRPNERLEHGRLAGAVRADHGGDRAARGRRSVSAVQDRHACRSRRRRRRTRDGSVMASVSEIGFDHLSDSLRPRPACPRRAPCPSTSTTIRVHSAITKSMLCSMTTKVAPCSALIAFSRSRRLAEHGQVDAAGRLVEQHEARPGHERHRDVEQLLLAVATGRRPARRRDGRGGRSRSSGRPPPRGRRRAGRTGGASIVPWCSCPATIRLSRTVSCGKTCSSWNVRLDAEPVELAAGACR